MSEVLCQCLQTVAWSLTAWTGFSCPGFVSFNVVTLGALSTRPKTACPISPAARVTTRQTMQCTWPAVAVRELVSLVFPSRSISPFSYALCAIDIPGPSGSGRAITFGPEIHRLLRDSCLSKTVAWGSDFGASFTLQMRTSPPSAQSSGLEEAAVIHEARLRGSSDLADRCRPRCQMLQLRGASPYQCLDLRNDFWIRAVRWSESS